MATSGFGIRIGRYIRPGYNPIELDDPIPYLRINKINKIFNVDKYNRQKEKSKG